MNEFKKFNLKNGLPVFLIPNKASQVVTTMIMFGVGSRFEEDEVAGISHVLEHMHFKGTKKRPTSSEIARFIDATGGEHNAFTGKEHTGYYAKVAPSKLELVFDFLSDLLFAPLFDEKELEKEKNVILQEYDMYEDIPMEIVGSRYEEAVFGKNALGRDVIGYKKSIKSITKKDLTDYREAHYKSDNAVLVLSGNFGSYKDKDVIELAERYFKIEPGKAIAPPTVKLNNNKTYKLVRKSTEQSHLVIGFRTLGCEERDSYVLDLLALILGGSMSSRMFEEIREKRGLAYTVKTSTINHKESGSLETQSGVLHGKVYETIEAILEQYKKVKKELIPDGEIRKAKDIISGKTLIRFEDSEDLAHYYASEYLTTRKAKTPAELLSIYESISASDILNVAKKYFTDDRLALAVVSPEIDGEKIKKIFRI